MAEYQTIKPNIKKIFLKNIITIIGSLFLIIIALLILKFITGLNVLLIPFESIGITADPSTALLSATLGLLGIAIFLIFGNYLVNKKIRCELYQDKIIFYSRSFLLFSNSKEIPYGNIVKVAYTIKDIFDKLFNSGTIVLELSGMSEDKIELEFIDNVEENTKYIQNLINTFNYDKQEQSREKYKLRKIIDEI